MLIFSRYNLVLLAVPKTGSTALEVALGQEADGRFGNPPELKHLPLYRYNRFVQPLLQLTTGKDPETFALIREPISWLRSWYLYRARNCANPRRSRSRAPEPKANALCAKKPVKTMKNATERQKLMRAKDSCQASNIRKIFLI